MAVLDAPAAATASDIRIPDDHVIVLFGSTGDLARRKLIPGLYRLSRAGLMPHDYRVVGTSQGSLTDEAFREHARAAVHEFGRGAPVDDDAWRNFASRLSYVDAAGGASALGAAVNAAERALGGTPRRLHYLSVPPAAFSAIVRTLDQAGLAENARVILEKPFGYDLETARALNQTVHSVFPEQQVFRIDHFLGKESAQNILALRFANGLFEPVWNREYIDHVQIDVPETLSIGMRATFYERTGAFRDMIVTHLFQVLGFVAMEPPTALRPKPLVDEKVKVFESLTPLRREDVLRGQYEGYRQEPGVAADSETETFVAVRAFVDNWRWAGVPFYLRTGKRLAEGRRVITIGFRRPPRRMFELAGANGESTDQPNKLVIDLGEPGGITANFLAKVPGARMVLGPARMSFRYEDSFCIANQLEAYERLVHDAMIGDHTLFTRSDGIERLWEVAAPVLAAPPPVLPYSPGTWGPEAVDAFIAPHRWQLPEQG